jgi:hypothetical protein
MPLLHWFIGRLFFRRWGWHLAPPIDFEIFVRSTLSRADGARFPDDIATANSGMAMLLSEGRAGYHGTLTDEFTRSGNG